MTKNYSTPSGLGAGGPVTPGCTRGYSDWTPPASDSARDAQLIPRGVSHQFVKERVSGRASVRASRWPREIAFRAIHHSYCLVICLLFSSIFSTTSVAVPPPITVEIPVERLMANIEDYIAKNPNDYRGYHYAGRVLGIAWARGLQEFRYHHEVDADDLPGAAPNITRDLRFDLPEALLRKDQYRRAVQYYETAVRLAEAKGNGHEFSPKLGYAWLCEEGARANGRLGAPPFTPQTDVRPEEVERIQKGLLEMADGADFDTVPALFDDIDSTLTVIGADANSIDDLDKGSERFVTRLWLERAFANYAYLFEHIDALRQQVDHHPYDQVLSESSAGLMWCLQEDPTLSDKPIQLRMRAKRVWKQLQEPNEGRYVTPILISLQPSDNVNALLAEKHVVFNLDGDLITEKWPWVAPDTGLLVWRGDGEAPITSGRQLIGSRTWWVFWRHGYEPLQFLDDDGDGWLRGDELDGLCLWFDSNSNGVDEPGETLPVTAHGVAGLATQPTGKTAQGWWMHDAGVELADGMRLPTYDWEPRAVE